MPLVAHRAPALLVELGRRGEELDEQVLSLFQVHVEPLPGHQGRQKGGRRDDAHVAVLGAKVRKLFEDLGGVWVRGIFEYTGVRCARGFQENVIQRAVEKHGREVGLQVLEEE